MKKLLIFMLVACFTTAGLQAQSIGHSKIKSANKIVWLGVDLSAVQCVGRAGFTDADDIVGNKFASWNELFIAEHDKYNVSEALKKETFHYDLESVDNQNQKASADGLIVAKAEPFDEAMITSMVNNYSSTEYPDELGLVFIVESLNKNEQLATVHVTVFNLGTKEIVKSVKYTGEPRGFGFRNYWAGAFNDVIENIEKDYGKWMKAEKKRKK